MNRYPNKPLSEPVRPFENTVFAVVKKHFAHSTAEIAGLVEVTQADRDAAADLEHAIGDRGYSHALRSGRLSGIDSDVRVQAFARHRRAHGVAYVEAQYRDVIGAKNSGILRKAAAMLTADAAEIERLQWERDQQQGFIATSLRAYIDKNEALATDNAALRARIEELEKDLLNMKAM